MRQIRLVFCCWRFFRDTITIILRFPKRTLFTSKKSDLALCHLENSHSRRWLSKWRTQTTKRETDLTYLHFERKTLMELKFDNFLKIWQSKPRKVFFIWSNCPWFLFIICISFARKFFIRKLGKNSHQILGNSERYDKITVRGFYSFIGSSKKIELSQ